MAAYRGRKEGATDETLLEAWPDLTTRAVARNKRRNAARRKAGYEIVYLLPVGG